MKQILWLSLIILNFNTNFVQEKFTIGDRPRSITCFGDNLTLNFPYCNIKAYSAKLAVINVGVEFLKTVLKPIYFQVIMSYRFGNIYRPMIDTKAVDLCSIMDGNTFNLFLKIITDRISQYFPHVLHKCPYEKGEFLRLEC